MKVLVVTTWYPSTQLPTMGVFVQRDCHVLALDHDVTVVHLAPASSGVTSATAEKEGDLRVLRLPFDPSRPGVTLRSWRRLLGLVPAADLVHTMAFSSILPLVPAPRRRPWVHTEHWSGISSPWSLPTPLRRAMPVLGRALALPDVVTAVCEFLAVPVRQRRGRPTLVVPCVVEQRAPLVPRRALTGATTGPVRLVAVGGLVPGKDPGTAVRTVAELRRRGVDCTLTWVGGGPLEATVRDLVNREGLDDVVTLLGAVPSEQVSHHLSEADLFLLPTRHENFCVSAAEALLAGRPVVIGSHGGQAEYVDDSVGALVHTQEPEAYAAAVQGVLERLRDQPAEHFRRRVEERFSAQQVREGYHAAYELACGSRPGSRS